jgi:hypothetical protein
MTKKKCSNKWLKNSSEILKEYDLKLKTCLTCRNIIFPMFIHDIYGEYYCYKCEHDGTIKYVCIKCKIV